ncbi:hypothetical protein PHYSODRAFT_482700 [Phytophthora sojae]|uniref:Uncharacterized protein n=1 Tax=Phytophthora sojae (strain P6497) TaxID=1094619 RepID=G4YTV8_PHYSP|nr:hypothetical protein PHYSODRAFT_482700 [Phytophthora sojae]EGZ25429.1 hypothetical protein PHYSODRAFT_482700 [Phytophthora sojae]|eukprot:XP_009520717.1 hypothetical protein PHYSODRAFT_482700 [Phytophthora sojae]
MRQSVHPMEANADGDKRRKLGMEDDDWQDLATENSSESVNGTSDPNAHEFEDDDIEGAAEVLHAAPQTGGNEYTVTKTGRQLTFADETGGALVEMNYSNRTHYSKQAGPGTVQGVPKGGCCVIQ